MKLSLLFVLFGFWALPWSALGQESFEGTWVGHIEAGEQRILTTLYLSKDAEGSLGGTVDSPDQGAFGFELSEVKAGDAALSFRVPETQARFEGLWDSKTEILSGNWIQRGATLALTLKRAELNPLCGTWSGVCDFGAVKLRLLFHVGEKSDGSLGANMVSPDQSSTRVPVSNATVKEGEVEFDIQRAAARFKGRLNDQENSLEGEFSQGGQSFDLTLEKKSTAPSPPKRPQTPKPPFPYTVEDVVYTNKEQGHELAGTLTYPEGGGSFPAVIMVTGSGQQDRNEEIFHHKPFWVIADALTRKGIAVLRVDDRGVGGSGGDVVSATSADFATDVSAGIDYLLSRDEIRADQVGIIGHSEGGLIAPMVARDRDDVAFIVLLAGPGVSGEAILFDQAALLARAQGAQEAAIDANRQMQAKIFEVIKEEPDPKKVKEKLKPMLEGVLGAAAESELSKVSSPWFCYFVKHDPATVLAEVSCPVLALNGELDLQVSSKMNLDAIEKSLDEGGNPDVVIKAYEGLNHLFQPCEIGTVSEYQTIEMTFSEEVIDDIIEWVKELTEES